MMNHFARNKFGFVFAAVSLAVALFSCHQPDVVVGKGKGTKVFHPSSVYQLAVNNGGYGITSLEGLPLNNDVYLAKIKNNRVAWNRSVVPANSGAEGESEESQSLAEVVTTETGETFLCCERHWKVTPPDEDAQIEAQNRNRMRSYADNIGSYKNFFVDMSPNATVFESRAASLRYIGTYCKVWVVDGYFQGQGGNFGVVTEEKVTMLGQMFDLIYPIETNLLGYEYGGGPGGNGGMDGDPHIQILLFDIDGDQNASSNGGITQGYFYPGDAFARGEKYPSSNEAEIFYLDSNTLNTNPTAMYSTLIHEFNHMINFNVKVLGGGEYVSWNTEVWYTEMLSMLAEDTIGPLVGITPGTTGHVTTERISKWLKRYADLSVMYWPPSSGNALYYYSSNYAFGAYLVRNFGGPALFSAIAKSPLSGRGAIDGFLRSFSNDLGVDTNYAMSRFSEALLYSGTNTPEGVLTFDKTVTDVIGQTVYTFQGFDIWTMSDLIDNTTGPQIREYAKMPEYTADDNTVQLYTDETWADEIANNGGRLTMRLLNVDPDADYYLMMKPKPTTP